MLRAGLAGRMPTKGDMAGLRFCSEGWRARFGMFGCVGVWDGVDTAEVMDVLICAGGGLGWTDP